ncbi:MAG: radical SAM protein [Deltaproteobacteria bacterium]|nr:radical SAM protein [Deltaproteobacteria bacterium]
MNYISFFKKCELCPRGCKVDRTLAGAEKKAFCGQSSQLRVAHIGPHHGEEPPISGSRGSGTIFFSGCSLRCSFCQNHQISMEGIGDILSPEEFYNQTARMIDTYGVHNINFVTPDHFFPYTFHLVEKLRENGYSTPILYNTSGYQTMDSLKIAEKFADIYLPDFKYSDPEIAKVFSRCKDYPQKTLDAIAEMVRQKGFLDSYVKGTYVATKGVLVRHLILPGKIENSIGALDSLFLEFGANIPISLMSQYHPVIRLDDADMNRFLTVEEFKAVYSHALELGFNNMFVQFPSGFDWKDKKSEFLPDFNEESPFKGNKK